MKVFDHYLRESEIVGVSPLNISRGELSPSKFWWISFVIYLRHYTICIKSHTYREGVMEEEEAVSQKLAAAAFHAAYFDFAQHVAHLVEG